MSKLKRKSNQTAQAPAHVPSRPRGLSVGRCGFPAANSMVRGVVGEECATWKSPIRNCAEVYTGGCEELLSN
jgi:hypothetical protein